MGQPALNNTCLLIILVCLVSDFVFGAPWPNQERQGIKAPRASSWGIKSDTLPIQQIKDNDLDLDKAIQQILRQNNSPSLRLFLTDKLLLQQLQLLLDKPNNRHYAQLQNRLKTLRNRRKDEVTSRFFLRD